MRLLIAVVVFIGSASWPSEGQLFNRVSLDRLNRQLCGRVDDYTMNHGQDHRISSPILGQKRDMYVYLPPNYNPRIAYPMILLLHTAMVDEHALIGPGVIETLDEMITRGECPPIVVGCPDGTYDGENKFRARHSLYVNGLGGRFEDHLIQEVMPFLMRTYSIRPEREAHAIFGTSAGGYGGMGLALKHRDVFGAIATLAGPLNMRYDNCDHDIREDFDPATYRWKTNYDPGEIAATYYFGLWRSRTKKYLEPVYGKGPDVFAKIILDNPADLLFSTDLQPGELAIYINYPGKDNWNFDAQDQSFAWLAAQKGVDVTLVGVPRAQHSLRYFRSQQRPAYLWLAKYILPPTPRS